MNARLLITILFLAIVSGHVYAMSHTPTRYTPPEWSENADANTDAAYAIAHNDYRLLAYYTRSLMLPGISPDEKDLLIQKCGLRTLKGFGDVISSEDEDQLKKMSAMHRYATRYNSIIAPLCRKQARPENQGE